MKKESLLKKAKSLNLNTKVCKMAEGDDGLFISLEWLDDSGMAQQVAKDVWNELHRYLYRHKVQFEYRASHTSILIRV